MSIREGVDSKFSYGFPAPGLQNPTAENVLTNAPSAFFLDGPGFEQARLYTPYDYVIIGSSFCALAFCDAIFRKTPSAKVLVLERGPFFLPEHFQNLPLPFQYVLGGHAETFPWKTSVRMEKENAHIKFNRGAIPFFGGRSTLWSSFCPTPSDAELEGWPEEMKKAAHSYIPAAKKLLHVKDLSTLRHTSVYGAVQRIGLELLNTNKDSSTYLVEGAPLACRGSEGVEFEKYAVIRDLLNLYLKVNNDTKAKGQLDIAVDCLVTNIVNDSNVATALETSRGTIALGNAELILAMGALPPVTLLRNSFKTTAPDIASRLGRRFAAHFITSMIARVPKELFAPDTKLNPLEMGGYYVAGTADKDYKRQFHIDLSLYWVKDPIKSQATALRYMPDVVANPSLEQFMSSVGYVIIVCASLGEIDSSNPNNWFLEDPASKDVTTNSILQVLENERDAGTWKAMDDMTFHTVEQSLGKGKVDQVEYWIEDKDRKGWFKERPSENQRRTAGLVHESSTLHVGTEAAAPVGLDYKVKGTANVYVTGAGLWPRGGSWNPTLTMAALASDLGEKLADKRAPKKTKKAVSKL